MAKKAAKKPTTRQATKPVLYAWLFENGRNRHGESDDTAVVLTKRESLTDAVAAYGNLAADEEGRLDFYDGGLTITYQGAVEVPV